MSPRGTPEQALKRKAYRAAGHATVHHSRYGQLGDVSINQNGESTPVTHNSFCKYSNSHLWPTRKNILLTAIGGPLAEALYNNMKFDEKTLRKKAESNSESDEAQILKLLEGDPLPVWIKKVDWIFCGRTEKLKNFAETLIVRGFVLASKIKEIPGWRWR